MQTTLTINITIEELREVIAEEVAKAVAKHTPAVIVAPEKEELMKVDEVAKLFKVSKVTIFEWKKKGKLPFYRIARKVFFKRADMIEAMARIGGK